MTAIILINWNGADDTLACLASLERASGNFCVVIADNGSTDDSLFRIEEYLTTSPLRARLLPLGQNWGFAVGNNKAIAYAREAFAPDWYLLLNNDTEVEPDFLSRMLSVAAAHPELKVLTPRIAYYSNPSKIWLCGGHLTFGSRKKCFADADVTSLPSKEYDKVTFVSGCALMARASLLQEDGTLLSNRFFFGEEDYEFALRMQQQHQPMACVYSAVIYHKVGASHKRMNDKGSLRRIRAYYLGRLICAREYYSRFQFGLIRMATAISCYRYFLQAVGSKSGAMREIKKLMRDCRIKETVTREDLGL